MSFTLYGNSLLVSWPQLILQYWPLHCITKWSLWPCAIHLMECFQEITENWCRTFCCVMLFLLLVGETSDIQCVGPSHQSLKKHWTAEDSLTMLFRLPFCPTCYILEKIINLETSILLMFTIIFYRTKTITDLFFLIINVIYNITTKY